jgi:hypothetical protein
MPQAKLRSAIRTFATIAIFSTMTALDPLLPFEIGHMNEREARESGPSPKAQLPGRIHLF